jgi:hypothetical protein
MARVVMIYKAFGYDTHGLEFFLCIVNRGADALALSVSSCCALIRYSS